MSINSQNSITVSEDIINRVLKPRILASPAGDYLNDYKVTFSQGSIYLMLSLQIKTLGALKAQYKIDITDLTFRPGSHILIADYIEDVRSSGSFAQSMMLKAAGLKGGTFLQSVISMTNPPGIKADSRSCSVDLKKLLRLDERLASMLILEYSDARNGLLQLAYQLAI